MPRFREFRYLNRTQQNGTKVVVQVQKVLDPMMGGLDNIEAAGSMCPVEGGLTHLPQGLIGVQADEAQFGVLEEVNRIVVRVQQATGLDLMAITIHPDPAHPNPIGASLAITPQDMTAFTLTSDGVQMQPRADPIEDDDKGVFVENPDDKTTSRFIFKP